MNDFLNSFVEKKSHNLFELKFTVKLENFSNFLINNNNNNNNKYQKLKRMLFTLKIAEYIDRTVLNTFCF